MSPPTPSTGLVSPLTNYLGVSVIDNEPGETD